MQLQNTNVNQHVHLKVQAPTLSMYGMFRVQSGPK